MRIPSLLEQRVRDQMITVLDSLSCDHWKFKYTGEETWLFYDVIVRVSKERIESALYNHLTKILPVIYSWERDSKGNLYIKILEKPGKSKIYSHIIERDENV